MIWWAGRGLALIGGGHLAIGLLLSRSYFDDWFALRLWGHWTEDTHQASYFWANPAGFGWPLLLIGLTVVWMDRRGITPPLFLAWMVLGWAVVCAVIAEPTPGPVLVAFAVMLLRGVQKASGRAQTVPAEQAAETQRAGL
ncbi:DUF6463 family protein [Actinomadura rupiterrae]|uniref:DUF6463 family protein n=1 Tax=Actinomadura rupiterrae TaxID=559627 RepID=UPI0020A502D9|nr:DUF6463 family protein [Actinomadura rupiterrae]MCP2339775.1 hypothetical protein [Actinomadura rupiterrae]